MSEQTYSKGGLSTFFAEVIERHPQEPGRTVRSMTVYAEREVTMTEDLSAISDRRLRCIVVEFNSGWPDSYWVARLSRNQATRLRNSLDAALRKTDGDSELRP